MKVNDIGYGLGKVGSAIGRGLIAGMAGTAAITLSQMIEMQLTKREASDTPAKVGGKTLGVQPRNPEGKQRFIQIMHWGYGTSWGMFRGVLSLAGLKGPVASGMHFSAVWGTELVMIPSMTPTPPATEWGAEQLSTDALHHLVYAVAAGVVFDLIDQDQKPAKKDNWIDEVINIVGNYINYSMKKSSRKIWLK